MDFNLSSLSVNATEVSNPAPDGSKKSARSIFKAARVKKESLPAQHRQVQEVSTNPKVQEMGTVSSPKVP